MNPTVPASLEFGVLTLATPNDYLKAIGLALSLEVSNPGVPRAVACSEKLFPVLRPFFQHLVPEQPGLKGFAHKVYLDRYTPFQKTLFLDSDVLVFQPVLDHIKQWPDQPYVACGKWAQGGRSAFGLDRKMVMQRLGVDRLVCIDGAGHAYFDKTDSVPLFERGRYITEHYSEFGGGAKYADEDAMNMVMTEAGLIPAPYGTFFARYLSAMPGTMQMDARRKLCRFIARDTGKPFEPCMVHFAADEAPLAYTYELWRLFGAFGVTRLALLPMGAGDFYRRKIKPPLARFKQRLKK